MGEFILTEKNGYIGTITVNRPDVRNALNKEAWLELRGAFTALDRDDEIRAIILTGAGEKAFIAGADLTVLKTRSSVETFYGVNQQIVTDIEMVSKPTIAMINGYCLGGGLEVAMACDIRIASDDAKLGQTELNVGILPGCGGTQRLARYVGLGKAKELIFTGKLISAQEAEQLGLVNCVVPKSELLAKTLEMVQAIAAKSPIIVKIAKLVINRGAESDLASGLQAELLAQSLAFSTEDHLEGINAFLEKREPKFNGK
ncbi:MAG: enoyl-CoA hydratase-related protein [Synergistaceae bacterium]|nr:enoyl-CoA hydratase-related protein [Synergistaceae bacterium]